MVPSYQPSGEVLNLNKRALGQDEAMFDDVLEFADVTRVVVGHQETQSLGSDSLHPLLVDQG